MLLGSPADASMQSALDTACGAAAAELACCRAERGGPTEGRPQDVRCGVSRDAEAHFLRIPEDLHAFKTLNFGDFRW